MSDVVKVAVNIEHMQIPIKIQATAKVRPRMDLGARSPYLQVLHMKQHKRLYQFKGIGG